MPQLKDIFENNITLHSSKWEPYFNVYERYFHTFCNKPITMIEIGVDRGGSLQLWREYFGTNARIIGIDCDENCLQYSDIAEIYIGDQADINFWDNILPKIGPIDIVLDDGGHLNNQQIVTFEKLFPKLNLGGIYMCEDTHTSYWPRLNTYEGSFIEYSKKLVDYIHSRFDEGKQFDFNSEILEIVQDLESISFYNSMVVFNKESNKGFNYISANPHKNLTFVEVEDYFKSKINK